MFLVICVTIIALGLVSVVIQQHIEQRQQMKQDVVLFLSQFEDPCGIIDINHILTPNIVARFMLYRELENMTREGLVRRRYNYDLCAAERGMPEYILPWRYHSYELTEQGKKQAKELKAGKEVC